MESDDSRRFVVTAKLMFSEMAEAQNAAQRIESVASDALAVECFIEEVTPH